MEKNNFRFANVIFAVASFCVIVLWGGVQCID